MTIHSARYGRKTLSAAARIDGASVSLRRGAERADIRKYGAVPASGRRRSPFAPCSPGCQFTQKAQDNPRWGREVWSDAEGHYPIQASAFQGRRVLHVDDRSLSTASGFSGFEEAEKHRDDPYRRIRMLEESWARDTGDHRFIPHIQLHEYEAYLFVDVSVLSEYYQGHEQAVAMLEASVEAFDSPELIDDGIETAPSKRIMSHLPGYASDKPTVGVQAAERIGLSAIRQRCSHFSSWLEQIEGLSAQEIG